MNEKKPTAWEKIFANPYTWLGTYISKDLSRYLPKEEAYKQSISTLKESLNTNSYYSNANQSHNEIPLHIPLHIIATRMVIIFNEKSVGEDGKGIRNFICFQWECKTVQALWKTPMVPQKVTFLSCDSATPSRCMPNRIEGIQPCKNLYMNHRNIIIIVKNIKTSQVSIKTEEWIKCAIFMQ